MNNIVSAMAGAYFIYFALVLVANVVIAIFFSKFAAARGFGRKKYFWLTCLLGILISAIIFYFEQGSSSPETLKSQDGSGIVNFKGQNRAACPNCAEFISIDAKVCRFCTNDVSLAMAELKAGREAMRARAQHEQLEQKKQDETALRERKAAVKSFFASKLFKAGVFGLILLVAAVGITNGISGAQRTETAKQAKIALAPLRSQVQSVLDFCQEQETAKIAKVKNSNGEDVWRVVAGGGYSSSDTRSICLILQFGGFKSLDAIQKFQNDTSVELDGNQVEGQTAGWGMALDQLWVDNSWVAPSKDEITRPGFRSIVDAQSECSPGKSLNFDTSDVINLDTRTYGVLGNLAMTEENVECVLNKTLGENKPYDSWESSIRSHAPWLKIPVAEPSEHIFLSRRGFAYITVLLESAVARG